MRPAPDRSQPDPQAMSQALTLLHPPGSVIELRIPHAITGQRGARKTYRGTIAGFFNDCTALIQEAMAWSGRSDGIYITLNPITPALLARYANRVEEGATGLTTDDQVLRRCWLPLDFDASRLAKISATEVEHQVALQRALACREWLRQQHWPEPLYADSGNGAHLLYRLDLPNDAASTALVARVLHALALLWNDAQVTVDASTANAARVWKLYGTLVCKGDHLPDRPHRLARLLEVPASLAVVPAEYLAALAARIPAPPPTRPALAAPGKPFDLATWIAQHALSVVSHGPWINGGYKWILNPCPWNPEHTNRAAYLVQFANGAIAAGCHHNGCADKDWQALRHLYDPGRHSVFKPGEPVKTASHGVSSSHTGAASRRPHVVTLATVQPEAVSWLWKPYIPRRKLTLVEGDPGMGKTWLMLQLAAAISRGTALPGCEEATQASQGGGQPVLYLSAEDGLADTLRPRLDAAGADCTHVHALLGWQEHAGATVKTGSITLADIPIIQTAIATYQPALVLCVSRSPTLVPCPMGSLYAESIEDPGCPQERSWAFPFSCTGRFESLVLGPPPLQNRSGWTWTARRWGTRHGRCSTSQLFSSGAIAGSGCCRPHRRLLRWCRWGNPGCHPTGASLDGTCCWQIRPLFRMLYVAEPPEVPMWRTSGGRVMWLSQEGSWYVGRT